MHRLCPITGDVLFKKNSTINCYTPSGNQARMSILMEKEEPEYVNGVKTDKKIKRHHTIFVAVSKEALKKDIDYVKLFNDVIQHTGAGKIAKENGFKPVGYEKR